MVWINAEIACPTKDGKIGINMQSGKNLEAVVGHEITHVLEGTEFYNEMQKALYDYTDAKGELQTRRKAIEDLYEGVTQDIDSELTAELVGDYLFTDTDFITRLANDNRNLFQKIWDEIKYMWKQAHPSSPEAAKLEKLKRAFEKAYQDGGKVKGDSIKFSINPEFNDAIDRWDGKTIGFSFIVGETSNALQQAGIPQKQIRWDASKIKTLLDKHSGMSIETIKGVPKLLENPILVIDSKKDKNSKIVMGELYDDNGKIVTAVLLLTPTSKKGNVLDLVKISSAEGRSHIKSLFTNEDGSFVKIRYVDKKRIQSWLNVNRLQLPLHNLDLDSNISISQNSEKSSIFEKKTFDNDFSAPEGDIIAKFSLSADEDIGPVRDDVKQKKEERINKAYTRIDNKLQQDKIALEEDLATTRADLEQQLADKSAYISNRASELYNELSNLKKGVRASKALGYLLDHGYDWNTLKSTLLKVKRWASETVNPNSVGNHRCHGFL